MRETRWANALPGGLNRLGANIQQKATAEIESPTPESMKAWEERLGPDKMKRVFDLMRSHGWKSGDNPPMWMWAEAFRQVESGEEIWGGAATVPSLQESIFGFKLF